MSGEGTHPRPVDFVVGSTGSSLADRVRRLVGLVHDPLSGRTFDERMAAYADELRRLIPFSRMVVMLGSGATLRPSASALHALPSGVKFAPDLPTFSLDHPLEDSSTYLDHYARFDAGATVVLERPGRVHTLSHALAVAGARWGADPFTSDYAPRIEMRSAAAGAAPALADTMLLTSVWRPEVRHAFERAEVRALSVLLRELGLAARALQLDACLRALALRGADADVRAGTLLLDRGGELLDADAGARALAAACEPPGALGAVVAGHARRLCAARGAWRRADTRRTLLRSRGGAYVDVTVALTPRLPGRVLVLLERLDAGTREAVCAHATASGLTPREREVAVLVARGHTNREIALELGVVPGTVKLHLERCYRKLGVSGRAELAHRLHLEGGGVGGGAEREAP